MFPKTLSSHLWKRTWKFHFLLETTIRTGENTLSYFFHHHNSKTIVPWLSPSQLLILCMQNNFLLWTIEQTLWKDLIMWENFVLLTDDAFSFPYLKHLMYDSPYRFCTSGLPSDLVVEVEEMSFHLHKVMFFVNRVFVFIYIQNIACSFY